MEAKTQTQKSVRCIYVVFAFPLLYIAMRDIDVYAHKQKNSPPTFTGRRGANQINHGKKSNKYVKVQSPY